MVTWDVGSAMLACYKQRFKRRVDMNYGVMTARFQSEKYVNIPSGKYIYVHKYVYICVYTYLCKMDEYRHNAGLS